MYHQVTRQLVLVPDSSTGNITEFSRAVETGEQNYAEFDVWLVSSTGTINTLDVTLQGSNDLSNWEDITTLNTAKAFPSHESESEGLVPWAFVRLKYFSASLSNDDCLVRGAIKLTTPN